MATEAPKEAASSPRPFATLGALPFLHASDADLRALQKHYIQLSRQTHPDRVTSESDEDRERVEALSARLNADYATLRDFWKRAESVALAQNTEGLSPVRFSGPPPELAGEYFELQEAIQEATEERGVAAAVAELAEFRAKVKNCLTQAEAQVQEFCARYPYRGLGLAPAPWNAEDLRQLNALLKQHRYYRSFLRDIDARFPA